MSMRGLLMFTKKPDFWLNAKESGVTEMAHHRRSL
jgi:hypothetical protein